MHSVQHSKASAGLFAASKEHAAVDSLKVPSGFNTALGVKADVLPKAGLKNGSPLCLELKTRIDKGARDLELELGRPKHLPEGWESLIADANEIINDARRLSARLGSGDGIEANGNGVLVDGRKPEMTVLMINILLTRLSGL